MTSSELNQHDHDLSGRVWTGQHARELLDSICYDFGPRLCGSAAIRGAADRIAAVLKATDARDVHTEPVRVLSWQDGPSRVQVRNGRTSRAIEGIQHVHSAAGTAEGPLVDAGSAQPEELDRLGRKVDGAILLVRERDGYRQNYLPLWMRLPDARRRGAAGVLVEGTYRSSGPEISFCEINRVLPIPVVGIAREDGIALRSVMNRGEAAEAWISTAGHSGPRECANLVADFGPPDDLEEMIVMTAHLDCHHNSVGALDNLSGIVTTLEICRAIAPLQSKFRRRLRVALFTGEEYGFLGSRAFVKRHAAELDRVRLNFNLDCLFPQTAQGVAVMWSPAMRDVIDRSLKQTPHQVDVRDHFCMSSDYLSFMMEGVPAARPADFLNTFPEGMMHTRWDTPEKIPDEWIRANAMVFSKLLLRLLVDLEPLPSFRRSRGEIRALAEAEGVADTLNRLSDDDE